MSDVKIGIPLEGFAEFGREVAAQGAVLLKNEGQMLPLREEKISVFGRIQIDYYRSGTGSGGAVNVVYKTNLLDGLRAKKQVEVNEELAAVYEAWVKEHPFDNGGGGWAMEPWFQQEMPLSEEQVKAARAFGEKAIYVIGRTAGEDKDNVNEPGGYRLTEEERRTLRLLAAEFDQIAVILNVSNIIDMSWVDDPEYQGHIRAVLYAWQGGIESGNAAADVLVGDVVPGGKLTDTIAKEIEDYPATANYGDELKNIYQEDIYVGYRYFETFAPEKVLYPFGYGITYTTMQTEILGAKLVAGADIPENAAPEEAALEARLYVTARVTNTGDTYAGREVVQLYYGAPQGKLGRPAKELGAFQKSKLLQPGESEEITIKLPVKRMMAYDDGGYTGHKSSYVLEEGAYTIYAGTSVRDAAPVKVILGSCMEEAKEPFWSVVENSLSLRSLLVVCTLQEAGAPVEGFTRMKPGARDGAVYQVAWQEAPTRTISIKERIEANLPEEITPTGDQGYVLKDVEAGKVTLDQFVAQLSDEELATLIRGEGMCSLKVTPGTACAFGGVGDALLDKGIPIACGSDGPSGIRMDNGAKATQVPIGTLLASTWDPELVEELYVMEGKELLRNQIDTLLGPGINIHRHPLNGRNFEYFSEDPYLSGTMAAANVRGIRRGGSSATMKHYACNNQEFSRRKVNAVVSERALREIYLRGFEMAVKEGGAVSLMTSYNPINSYWAPSSYDLVTTILRKEWGYTGIVMTDWWAMMNDCVEAGPCDIRNTAAMIRAQNDLFMVVNNNGAEVNSRHDNTIEALAEGKLTRGELQRSAKNILRFIMQAPVFGRDLVREEKIEKFASVPEGTAPKTVDPEAIVIEENGVLQIIPQMEGSVLMRVKEGGVYRLAMEAFYKATDTAQSACQILLNGVELVTIQMTGSWFGIPESQRICRCELEPGEYEVTCHITKPGMSLNWLSFTKS